MIEVKEEKYNVNIEEDVVNIIITEPKYSTIEVGIPGIQGPKGDSASTFVYEQEKPSNEWYIKHNMEKYPSVTIVDSSHRVVIGDVEYQNRNELIVTFKSEFSGKAFLN